MNKEEKKIVVSDEFVSIYTNFNVMDQSSELVKLNRRELYLLLIILIDNMPENDDCFTKVVQYNFKPYLNDEIKDIYDVQDDKIEEIKNRNIENYNILKNLIEDSGYEYIETDNIVDKDGNKLPDVRTVDEIRDVKIDNIFNENDEK